MPLTVDTHAVCKNSPARAHLKSEKSRNIHVSLEVLHVHPVLSGVISCRKRVQIFPKILMYLSFTKIMSFCARITFISLVSIAHVVSKMSYVQCIYQAALMSTFSDACH